MSPTRPFAPPVFPGTRPRDGLKSATRARLAYARLRVRAHPPLAAPMMLTRYVPNEHGLDFLVYLWSTLYGLGEHLDILGSVAAFPLKCVQTYAACDVLVVHEQDAPWSAWEGVAAVIWSDDWIAGARYRLHYWIAPPFRHPRSSAQIAHAVLYHLFEVRLFQMVYGITPVTNRLALRILLRLGFTERHLWPGGTTDPHTGAPLAAMVTTLTREVWRRRQEPEESRGLTPEVADDTWMYETQEEE